MTWIVHADGSGYRGRFVWSSEAVSHAAGRARQERSMHRPAGRGRGGPTTAASHVTAATTASTVLIHLPVFLLGGLAVLIREDLAAVGVRLVWRTEDFGDYLDALEGGEAGLYRFGWAPDYPTLDESLYPLFHSASVAANGGHNYGRYAAEDVDALLDGARATPDPRERRRRYQEAEDLILARDQAIVPIMTYRHRAVASDRLEGFRLDPLGIPDLTSVRIDT
jgi:ABC-type oligopeptide transport system substrate-binding subunit